MTKQQRIALKRKKGCGHPNKKRQKHFTASVYLCDDCDTLIREVAHYSNRGVTAQINKG